jgi:glycosyltransferase involved in cell wall biosynthesis
MNMTPHISVVIPTCDRPEDLRRCLTSLAGVVYPRWNVVIVDQGSSEAISEMIAAYRQRLPQLDYCHQTEKNASLARNKGFAIATGEIVAYLDDDCTVESDWLEQVAAVFVRHPQAVLVFGSVRAAEHNPAQCFIPTYDAQEERRITRRWAFGGVMGASMYLRRAQMEHVVLFDPHFGPGAQPFGSAQDWDLTYRVLRLRGFFVKTPAVVVDHYGARDFRSGAAGRLGRSCALSTGGLVMKMLRCGDWAALLLLGVQALRFLSYLRPKNLLLLRQPTGLSWITWFLKGLVTSFQLQVDPQQCLYKAKAVQHVSSAV